MGGGTAAYAVAGAAKDAYNSEEAAAVAAAARSAGAAAWNTAKGIEVPEVQFDVTAARKALTQRRYASSDNLLKTMLYVRPPASGKGFTRAAIVAATRQRAHTQAHLVRHRRPDNIGQTWGIQKIT